MPVSSGGKRGELTELLPGVDGRERPCRGASAGDQGNHWAHHAAVLWQALLLTAVAVLSISLAGCRSGSCRQGAPFARAREQNGRTLFAVLGKVPWRNPSR